MKRGGCHTNTLTGSKYETFMAIYKTYAIQSSAKRKMSLQKDPEIRDVVSCMKLLSSFTNLYDLCKRQKKSIWFWNDDRIFILGWTVSLRLEKSLKILVNHLFLQMQYDIRTLSVSKWRCSHLTWLRSFSLSARDALHVMWRIYDLWCSLFLSASTLHLHNCGNNCAWERTTHILFRKYSTVYSLFDLALHFHFSLIFCISFVMCILAFQLIFKY